MMAGIITSLMIIVSGVVLTDDVSATGEPFQIGDTSYPLLSDAINSASAGDTIVMTSDCETSPVEIGKNLTLNLNGNRLTIKDGTEPGLKISNGIVSIVNGTITDVRSYGNTSCGLRVINVLGSGTELTTENLALESYTPNNNSDYNYVLGVREGATLSLNASTTITEISQTVTNTYGVVGITIHGPANDSEGTGSGVTTLSISDATVNVMGYAIAGSGSSDGTSITITDGSFTSTGSCVVYHPQKGDLTISGGEFTGVSGIQYCGNGKLTISGGVFRATAPASDFPQKPSDQNDGSTEDGAALSIISRGNGYQRPGDEIIVNITGGTFISDNNSPINSYRLQQNDETGNWNTGDDTSLDSYVGEINITGGDFRAAEGRSPIEFDTADQDSYEVSGGKFNSEIDESLISDGVSFEFKNGTMYVGDDINDIPSYNPGYDDEEDLPPFIPTQPAEEDDTVTIVACAAAAAVAAILAVFLVIDRKG